jgi:hypothetical protein
MSPSITTDDGTVIRSWSPAELALNLMLDVFEMALDENLPHETWLLRLQGATEHAYQIAKRRPPGKLAETMRMM